MPTFRLVFVAGLGAASLVGCGNDLLRLNALPPDAGSTHEAGTASDAGDVLDAGNADAGTPPDGGCIPLRIGIFGNPGANASSDYQDWLATRGLGARRVQTTPDEPLTAETLKPFDVVVLDWLTRDYTAEEAATFAAWVSTGGGVVALTGYSNDPPADWRANGLLAPLGVGYGGPLLGGPVTHFVPHPTTDGLTSVTFNGGYGVRDVGGSASERTAIAYDDTADGPAIVGFAITLGAGHAFVWGDEWIEFDSEWSSSEQIPQLWRQVFAWVSSPNKCELQPPP